MGLKYATHLDLSVLFRAGGSGPITPTLVTRKILSFTVKVLYFKNLVGPIIVQSRFFLKWSDQPRTPSPTPVIKAFKGSQHQGVLASVRCYNLVTTLMFDITGGWGCFWCMDAYVWVSGGVTCLFIFPVRLVRGPPV